MNKVEEVLEMVKAAAKMGDYTVKVFLDGDTVIKLTSLGFQVIVEETRNYYKVSWHNSVSDAGKARNVALKIKQDKFKEFVLDFEKTFGVKVGRRRNHSRCACGFQYDKLFVENVVWLVQRGYKNVTVMRDPDGIGLFVEVQF